SGGQIGTALVRALRDKFGLDRVLATDIKGEGSQEGPFEQLDILDADRLAHLVDRYQINQIYHLAAILSAVGEKQPRRAWTINMSGLFNVLELARERPDMRVFFPSSIAVFGNRTPKLDTPQFTVLEPNTVYGISKVSGEYWCAYYHNKFGVDVRAVRYPGIIGYEALPGGGTTDYAVEIFHQAIVQGKYECFLKADTRLPMMYMPDAIRATVEIMSAPGDQLDIRSGYNLAGISFSPEELAQEIKKHIPHFEITYKPDFRQAIADSWPESIKDERARRDWGWKAKYDLEGMTRDMLIHLEERYATSSDFSN
ncbi:MAG: NAD-dependent epimerase/dehydratase family protein, partial [Saprospiraceae bacterium]|nr:NAD-dependent epimerase/dehydratase family protein [Saprospiraceae bacterium]